MVTELLEGPNAGQVWTVLQRPLQAGADHAVGQEAAVQLQLQGRRPAEEGPLLLGRQVAVDDLLSAAQDEQAREAAQLRSTLLSQTPLLLHKHPDGHVTW